MSYQKFQPHEAAFPPRMDLWGVLSDEIAKPDQLVLIKKQQLKIHSSVLLAGLKQQLKIHSSVLLAGLKPVSSFAGSSSVVTLRQFLITFRMTLLRLMVLLFR